jgi:hypothetical protein
VGAVGVCGGCRGEVTGGRDRPSALV